MKAITKIFDTKETFLFLPKSTNMKRVYLSSVEEVEQAINLGKTVFKEETKNEEGENPIRVRFYITVPTFSLLQNAL